MLAVARDDEGPLASASRYDRAVTEWPLLLRRLSEKLLGIADEFDLEGIQEDEPHRLVTRWLGSDGARDADISLREAVLQTKLPDDYRAFLLASNGFRGLAGLPHGLCNLLPVEEIGWMREKDKRTGRLANYLEARAKGEVFSEEHMVDPDDFARTLLIGESDGNECILLLPSRLSDGWEVWTYHPETGFVTGDTFTELMESALEA